MFVPATSRLKRQGGPQSLHLPKRGTESVDELCFLVGHQRIMAIVASRGISCHTLVPRSMSPDAGWYRATVTLARP